jgi:DNA polymerase
VAYWKHLPEAARIPVLVAEAMPRAGEMVERTLAEGRGNVAARGWVPAKPSSLQACRCCPLGERATQAVPGEGPTPAAWMLVGEQPGDEEDLAGKPFVGPAGRVLRRALAEAQADPATAYITNAVKHFSFEPRGKRRIHKTPAQREIEACRVWLDDEIATVQPRVIVALGASALAALMHRRMPVGAAREATLMHASGARLVATYHPSAVLRAADAQAEAAMYAALVGDLRAASGLARMAHPPRR